MDEYTREWETLATQVLGLSKTCLIQSYIMGLKPRLQVELQLHDITSIEEARQKEKTAEKKFKRIQWPKVGRVYSRRRFSQTSNTNNTKYVLRHLCEGEKTNLEMQRIKERKCKRCGEKWDPKHKCAKGKETKNLYTCEATNDSDNEELDVEEVEDSPQFSPKPDNENIVQVSLSAMTSIS